MPGRTAGAGVKSIERRAAIWKGVMARALPIDIFFAFRQKPKAKN
jgi:hypothetical protein